LDSPIQKHYPINILTIIGLVFLLLFGGDKLHSFQKKIFKVTAKDVESGVITDFHIVSSSEVEATENVALNGWEVIDVEFETDNEKIRDHNPPAGKAPIITIYFDSGKYNATLDNRSIAIIKTLDINKDYYIYGHTNSIPVVKNSEYASNYELSIKRAKFTKNFISSITSIPYNKLKVVGFGALRPSYDNINKGLPKNRRVEIYEGY